MIVWIASYPRSGNTFFRLLLNDRFDVSTYSVFDDPLFVANGIAPIIGHDSLCGSIDELAQRPELYFIKTHRIQDARTDYPAIYIVRDGRDALVSCAHYELSYGGTALRRIFADHLPARVRGVIFRRTLRKMVLDNRFGGWSENVNAWHNRDAQTTVVRFEDLIRDPIAQVTGTLAELGHQMAISSHAVPRFENLQNRWPRFFRRGRSGIWREEMHLDIQSLFWQRHGSTMDMLGYF